MIRKGIETVLFLWDNFGASHGDRVEAISKAFSGKMHCIGVEERSHSDTYDWLPEQRISFEKITLFGPQWPGSLRMLMALMRTDHKIGPATWFLCNYDRAHIIAFAFWLRLRRRRVFLMGCSKFDDHERRLMREFAKYLALSPFQGAIASGRRSKDYFRLLGIKNVVGEYNAVDISRIRTLSKKPAAPDGTIFQKRNFVIVARLVPKKNLFFAVDAFARFTLYSKSNRRLVICGSGPLETALKEHVAKLGLEKLIEFVGFLQTEQVSQLLAESLALILPSIEEQFGNVVIEAQAVGLPVIISEVCGARDHLVRNWINGFIFEPDNEEGLAQFMRLLDNDEQLWQRMCGGATDTSSKGDVATFVSAVTNLLGKGFT